MAAEFEFDLNDLKFFGAVGASISHEMKNVLAIINEMMGLLDDLSRLSASGRSFDMDRLQQIASRMKTQIQRGNEIMRDLNRFAHSMDHEEQSMDLTDMVDFVSGLAKRRASLNHVTLEAAVGSGPVSTTTNAFALEHLLWACLEQALQMTAKGTTVRMSVKQAAAGPCIHFGPLESIGRLNAENPTNNKIKALAERLGAELTAEPSAKELILHLPANKK
jgi:C4-dicarboxylate-specific signal transduction histidine kinase